MSNQKNTLENIGYVKKIPKNAHPYDYEKIVIKKNNKEEILYRPLSKRESIVEKYDFSDSLEIYNSML